MNVLLDGEESYVVGTKTQIETLKENVGKLFTIKSALKAGNEFAEDNYAAYNLVNCATDMSGVGSAITTTGDFGYVYLTAGARIDDKSVLHSGDEVYDFYAKDATVYVWNETSNENGAYDKTTLGELSNDDLANKGIWVAVDGTYATKGTCTAIYVGQKLSSDTSLASAKWAYDSTGRGSLTFNSSNEVAVTLGTGETVWEHVKVYLTANDKNAFFDWNDDAWLKVKTDGTYTAVYETEEEGGLSSTVTKTFNLTAEDGYTTKDYKVTFTKGWTSCSAADIAEDTSDHHQFTVSLGNDASGEDNTIKYVNTVTVDLKGNAAVTTEQLLKAVKLTNHNDVNHNYGCKLELVSTNGSTTATGKLSIDRNDLFFKITTESGKTWYWKVEVIDSTDVPESPATYTLTVTGASVAVNGTAAVTGSTTAKEGDSVVVVFRSKREEAQTFNISITSNGISIGDFEPVTLTNYGKSNTISFSMPAGNVNVSVTPTN